MPRKLTLGFGDIRETDEPVAPRDSTSSPKPARDQDVEEIAQSLRPRMLDCLREASGEVGIRDLRSALGFPGECLDRDPQANPVNRILKQMRDAGEVVCREFDRGEPRQGRRGHRPEVGRELSLGSPQLAPVGRWSLAEITSPSLTSTGERDSPEASAAADIQGNEPIPPSEANPPAAAPPLVRPDRQFTFDGLPHYEAAAVKTLGQAPRNYSNQYGHSHVCSEPVPFFHSL